MSSVLGTHGGRGSSVYAASKAGIIGKSHEPICITHAHIITAHCAADMSKLFSFLQV